MIFRLVIAYAFVALGVSAPAAALGVLMAVRTWRDCAARGTWPARPVSGETE